VAERIREYECCALYRPDVEAETLDGAENAVRELVGNRGGEVRRVDRWNKRLLAYPIKRYTDGFYVIYHFAANPTLLPDLNYQLRYNDSVLRFLVLDVTEKERKRAKRLAGRKARQQAAAKPVASKRGGQRRESNQQSQAQPAQAAGPAQAAPVQPEAPAATQANPTEEAGA